MSPGAVTAVLAIGLVALVLGLLTASGALKRGNSGRRATLSGMFFPITWVVWYVYDEHPYRR